MAAASWTLATWNDNSLEVLDSRRARVSVKRGLAPRRRCSRDSFDKCHPCVAAAKAIDARVPSRRQNRMSTRSLARVIKRLFVDAVLLFAANQVAHGWSEVERQPRDCAPPKRQK
jgi:hypothetical protein